MLDTPTSGIPSAGTSSDSRLPKWARIVDAVTWLLAFLAVVITFTGGFRQEWLGLRFSLRSADRIVLIMLGVAALRHWYLRHPTIFEPFRNYLDPTAAANEERLFLSQSQSWGRRLLRVGVLMLAYTALVVAMTWPQVVQLDAIPDEGDPLLSTWRMSWVAHQLPRDPLHLFDGNIFHPEKLTLTYSDSHLLPSLMAAPLIWLGVHQIYAYNLLLLSGFVLSGVTMFMLVEALTGRREAALVSGAIFALYPYRFEHYPHLELQMTTWMPLVLLAAHRAFTRGRLRDGLSFGGTLGLQTLSSLYYSVFMTAYLIPVGGLLYLHSRVKRAAVRSLAIGAVVTAVLAAPVVAAYVANRAMVSERPTSEIQHYSALPSDYLHPHGSSATYASVKWDSQPHVSERELFPTFTPVALALVGIWPPLSVARLAYAAGLVWSFDASLGFNGTIYPYLHQVMPGFRGLRVPARFSIVLGMTLAVLAGYGVARMTRRRGAVTRWAITAVLLGAALIELRPQLNFHHMWLKPSPVYNRLRNAENVVLLDMPMPRELLELPIEFRSMYQSTFHWHPILNGASGHYPESYFDLMRRMGEFPGDGAIAYLQERGVTHIALHEIFCRPGEYAHWIKGLDGRRGVELVATAPFGTGESRLYRLVR
jgi:hypothetical protein